MAEIILKDIDYLLKNNNPKYNVKELEKIEKYIMEQKEKETKKIKETDEDIKERLDIFCKKENLNKVQIKELNNFIIKKDNKNSKEQCADYYREDYYIYDICYKKKNLTLTFEFIGPYDEDGLSVYLSYDKEKNEMFGHIIKDVIDYLKIKYIGPKILFKYFGSVCENENFTLSLCECIEDYFNDSDDSDESNKK